MLLIRVSSHEDDETKVKILSSIRLHSNGVNSIDMISTIAPDGTNLLLVVSGGDDGSICASSFEILRDEVCFFCFAQNMSSLFLTHHRTSFRYVLEVMFCTLVSQHVVLLLCVQMKIL